MEGPPALKVCPDCGEEKGASEFGRNARMADGLARYCKLCFRRRSTESYRKRRASQEKSVREAVTVPEGYKRCPHCTEVKAVTEFGRNRAERSGLAAYCKPCHNTVMWEERVKNHGSTRNYQLKRRYGITEDDFERMLAQQGGLCAICKAVPGTFVDHCHRTGDVRYALCLPCNTGIGQFRDDPAVLWRALAYVDASLEVDEAPEVSDEEVRAWIAAEEAARSAFYERAVRVCSGMS